MPNNWVSFWFDTNSAWSLVDSPTAWMFIRMKWNEGALYSDPDEIYTNNRSVEYPWQGEIPNFGRCKEHIGGKTTLGEFFASNCMDMSIGSITTKRRV